MVQEKKAPKIKKRIAKKRSDSDEHYVIDLCDKILGVKAKRQHHFEFLRGDTLENGKLVENSGRLLPVDAYYEELNFVIEYWERQHTELVSFFDKKRTCDGRTRAEQRAVYDQRRKSLLPENGIKLVIIQYGNFGKSKRIRRKPDRDMAVIKQILIDNHVLDVNG